MNIQIFGAKKCNDTKKAERFFKERGIKYQFIDMKEKGMSKGEFNSVAQVNGGLEKGIEILQKAGYSIQENIQETADQTLNYYDENAASFSESTLHVDFAETQQAFLNCLSSQADILDFGCGAGRDTRYFLEQGHEVTAVDGSEVLCKIASEYTGIPVKQMLFQDLDETEKYDGIWACASILHLKKTELSDVLVKMRKALKTQGVIYTSFKYGDYEGMRNGRYFTDFTEESFADFMNGIPGLSIEKSWITGDVRARRGDERWINILLHKVDIP